MPHISRLIVSSALVASALWPVMASAQTQSEPQSAAIMTVDQARNAFSGAGYTVDQSSSWDWTHPPVTSFEVHGKNDGRVLIVLVYPSMTAAAEALLDAKGHEQVLNADQPVVGGSGPHMVAGFGASTWSGNVALVQSTEAQLERAYQAQLDRDNAVLSDRTVAEDPSAPNIAVDVDLLEALHNGAVSL